MSTPAEISTLSFEQARDELADLVQTLESGGHTLEASLALWERGELLAAHCQQWLSTAAERLQAATESESQLPEE